MSSFDSFELIASRSFYILLSLLFVALNAFFVAAEFALVRVRPTQLAIRAKQGNRFAKIAQTLTDNLDATLSTAQLGITLASLGLGWLGEPAFYYIFNQIFSVFSLSESTLHSLSFATAFALISALHIILGELVPKSIALQVALKTSLIVALPFRIFYFVFLPFLWFLNHSSNLFLRVIRFDPESEGSQAHTEEELKLILEDSYEEGTIGPRKKILLNKAMDFSHKRITDILVPRERIICFYLSETIQTNLTRAKESGHSRFPLLVSPDSEEVIGLVHMKDVIWSLENTELINLYDLKRPVLHFRPDLRIDAALLEFQSKKIHMGIVESNNKKLLGLITLENIIEQLVGDIEDEFDEATQKRRAALLKHGRVIRRFIR